MRKPFLILSIAAGLSVAIPSVQAAESIQYGGWWTYWGETGAVADVQDLRIFAWHFDSDAAVIPASAQMEKRLVDARTQRKDSQKRVWATVVNDQVLGSRTLLKDRALVHRLLTQPALRQRHLDDLVRIARMADGIELDYENLDPADRNAYTAFVTELAARLKAENRLLAVVVEPRTPTQDDWQGPGAVDWKAVSAVVDRFTVMAYFEHYSTGEPGPTASAEWLDQIARWAKRFVPADKLDIALCVEGIDWPAKGPGVERTFASIEKTRQKHRRTAQRKSPSGQPHFSYKQEGVAHEVWYEDARSLDAKIRVLRAAGIQTISFWRLGSGDPAFWKKRFAFQKGTDARSR